MKLAYANNVLQISCLRAEQTQLTKSLEKERQRAAENRQEYLAAKEEADTQEGRANQLEEEIKELRRKHKQELQEALMHRELLQQVMLLLFMLCMCVFKWNFSFFSSVSFLHQSLLRFIIFWLLGFGLGFLEAICFTKCI